MASSTTFQAPANPSHPDKPYDELWWIKQKLRRENLPYLPPTLALRKEAENALVAASQAKSEPEVRQIVVGINEKILEKLHPLKSGSWPRALTLDQALTPRPWMRPVRRIGGAGLLEQRHQSGGPQTKSS